MNDISKEVTCPHCGADLELEDAEMVQTNAFCNECKQAFSVQDALRNAGHDAAAANEEPESLSERTMTRYRDGYAKARAVIRIGELIKIAGGLITGIYIFGGILIGAKQSSGTLLLMSILVGVFTGVPIFVLGILVCAAGQLIKATLDTAVHTSPFLTDPERASAMSLSLAP